MNVRLTTTQRGVTCLLLVIALVLTMSHGPSEAKPRERKIFVLTKVELVEGAESLEALLRTKLSKAVDSHDQLLSTIPEDAPPVSEKKRFTKYMKKHSLEAFAVNVEVTKYEHSAVPNPHKPGNLISSAIKLRIFGETIPGRVMAFTGDGSASVQIEVGKKVRDQDSKYADEESMQLAVDEAITTSLKKLESRNPPKKSGKRTRKKRN